ncbi:ABC transporter family protein [Paraburkholderia xenovorans LB400]|uniref:Amino acid/amide ABC transporter ATP-binding protein 2, HAAT family n=1 Tax=Paraburkholderia xenovorans (strain LB400) TaxID=266265 RepID=Q13IE2_PARXL|nr:ABC transporter ATP-binding protein [Paraburkholderia xenovorans]ABE36147.1 amino acid/amide ABC transporter ATP-binding protein 2, HAAT family [Paraburkholderia xenovorans LB400]AIP35049.1 ABC transporter family protein [Paraburkholderia xenovorans LB400]
MNASAQPVLTVSDIHVAYGKTKALHGVSLEVACGEVIALIGANGAGKSTMLRAISGLLPLSAGAIHWNGNSIGGLAADRIVASGIAHCPEERHVWPAMTVLENLSLGAYLCRSREVVARRTELAFERFPRLRERSSQLAGTLSGGEQQMLAIARALMSEPRLLLLDEPSLGLSPKVAHEILDVIRAINEHGVTVLLVEQNVHNALSVAKRAYVFETGQIAATRTAEELLGDNELLAAYLGG